MKFLFVLAALLFTITQAQARVDGRFLAFIGMIAINDRVMGQVTDDDPQRLHEVMNVEEREEGGHRAKTIKLAEKKFTLLCSDRGGGEVVCTIVVKQGPQGTVNPSRGLIRFVALGEEAAALHKLFHADPQTGKLEYTTVDKSVRIYSDGQSFIAEYIKQ
jgi:hypothetical protein